MAASPYEPPRSEVRDVVPDGEIRERPSQVRTAVVILWVALGIGAANTVLLLSGAKGVTWTALIVPAATLGVLALFILGIRAGINWVRILYLVLFLVGLLGTVYSIPVVFGYSKLVGTLSVAQSLLQAYALYLVFTKPGSRWFHRARH